MMEFKNYKTSTVAFSKVSVNMPIDPTIERFIGARISEQIEMALGIPPAAQVQQDTYLTLDALRRVRPANKQENDTFVVNIDDALELFRGLKKIGYKVIRGVTAMGNKGSFFNVWMPLDNDGVPYAQVTVIVDTWRHTPRGQIIAFSNQLRGLKLRY